MRILQVNSARHLGGAETHVIELTDALRRRGHNVVVAGRRNGPVQPQIHLPFLNSADVYSAYRLSRFLKTTPFDVVHAHVARDYPVVAAAVRGLNVKLVLTRHLLYPIRAHALYRRVDGWTAPTSQILQTLAPLRPKLSEVIPNWVDVEKFRYRPHPLHRPINIGLLGQISPHKGHEEALAAQRILGGEYRLLIAGKGDDSYVRTLSARALDLPVEFLGFVDLPDFFEMVDILVAPSREEPFGIILLEAMGAGIPVIATAAGGPLDIIRPDIDGLLIPPKNPEALAAAVRALTHEDCRRRVIDEARKHVESEFDIRKVVPRIEGFYREVLAR